MLSEKSCGAVVYREINQQRTYLLLNYAAGHWDFPKGHVEGGETEQQTALRELAEETGIIEVEFINGFREEIQYSFQRREETVDKKVVFYIVKSASDKVKISSEHVGYVWLPYDGAREKLTYENTRKLLEKVDGFLDSFQ